MTTTQNIKGIEIPVVKCLVIANTSFIVDETPTKQSDKAIYVNVCNTSCGSNQNYWLPKSLITYKNDEFGTKQMVLPEWFCKKTFNWIA